MESSSSQVVFLRVYKYKELIQKIDKISFVFYENMLRNILIENKKKYLPKYKNKRGTTTLRSHPAFVIVKFML